MTVMRESRPEWNIGRDITPTSITYTGTEGKNSHRSAVQNIRFALTWFIVLWICSESCSFPKAAGLRVWSPQMTKAAASIGSREDLVHLVAPSVTYQRCLLVWDPSSHFQRFSLKIEWKTFSGIVQHSSCTIPNPPWRFLIQPKVVFMDTSQKAGTTWTCAGPASWFIRVHVKYDVQNQLPAL